MVKSDRTAGGQVFARPPQFRAALRFSSLRICPAKMSGDMLPESHSKRPMRHPRTVVPAKWAKEAALRENHVRQVCTTDHQFTQRIRQ